MAANNVLRVTNIDFDTNKASLKAFLSGRPEFSDYNFDSSTISLILDLLAYNTYTNAFYLNMVGNEMFLDSAQLRNSVVSRAKQLGYTPRSARGAIASLNVVVSPDNSPASVTVSANVKFTTSIDGVTYGFVTPESYNLSANDTGTFYGTINIVEGTPLQHRFTVDTLNPTRYILPNPNVDTTSLVVRINSGTSDTDIITYNPLTDISSVNSISTVYFVQENEDKLYEIYFGDNVFGKSPINGSTVIIDYRVVSGTAVNGANTFTNPASLGGYSTFTVNTSSVAQGGAEQESIASIKYNAPYKFQAQDRLVTVNDYKNTILSENGDLQSISVWGGEENSPPIYGKVFVSAKPTSGASLSTQRKELIKSQLRSRNVLAIDVEFVDPTFLYVVPSIKVRYDPSLTSLSAAALNLKIQTAVINFESNNLGTFGNKFYLSKLIAAINASDNSFIATDIDIKLQKRFIPITSSQATYTINFNNAIKTPLEGNHPAHEGSHFLTSSRFVYSNYDNATLDEDGNGTLRIYNSLATSQVYVKTNAGTVNYDTGLVTLDNIRIPSYSGDYMSVTIDPVEKNIFGVRNQIMLISSSTVQTINDTTGSVTSSVGSVPTMGVSTTNITETGVNTVII